MMSSLLNHHNSITVIAKAKFFRPKQVPSFYGMANSLGDCFAIARNDGE